MSAIKAISLSLSHPLHNIQLNSFVSFALEGESTWSFSYLVISRSVDCRRHWSDPGLHLLKPVVQLLCGVCVSCHPATDSVLAQVIPLLLKQYSQAEVS